MSSNSSEVKFACPANLNEVVLALPGQPPQTVTLPPCGKDDEEHRITVGGVPVILRRVHCVIHDGLFRIDETPSVRPDEPRWQLSPQTHAALLWRAYKRYDQLVGLKRLSGGLSGSDVLVFRPRLRVPDVKSCPAMASAGPPDVLHESWGTPLLVKSGLQEALEQEWERSETFLRDRQSPFLARNEELLDVLPVGPPSPQPHATMISSFLGGELVQAESLDKLIRGTRTAERALCAIDAVVGHLATWHTNPDRRLFAQWPRTFRFANSLPPDGWPCTQPDSPWLAYGQYNFRKRTVREVETWDTPKADGSPSLGRAEFAAGVGWDIPFSSTPHLERHLMGRREDRDGLLYKIAELPALFSLVHGDLNPRNVLCDSDRVWLIDFQHVGVGPILADLARLEVNFRLWCIELGVAAIGAPEAARELELLLLDHFHGSDYSLEPVRKFASALGADPDDLEKIARCIVHIRKLARRWCLPEFADGRDYLAALYLSVMSLLPHAGKGHTGPVNERWVMELHWVLENTLDRLFQREPFDRELLPYDPVCQVSAEFVNVPDTPRRVDYLCSTEDGREALQPVVALRGVLQGNYHHLDAYQHTLAVVAYVDELLENPVEGLLHPAKLDERVTGKFREYGLTLQPVSANQANPPDVEDSWFAPYRGCVEASLASVLDSDARLVLKWSALLHDVGKPGTRTVKLKGNIPEVQFRGHERYGATLLQSRLRAWFRGPDAHEPVNATGRRLESLIHNHHRSHQLIGDYFLRDTGRVEQLIRLVRGEHQPAMRDWVADHNEVDLPLLLLHGYADRLAARGVRQGGTVTEWATVTLALLTHLGGCGSQTVVVVDGRKDAVVRASRRRAAELCEQRCFADNQMNRVMGILRDACAGCSGTTEEQFLQHLRDTIDCAELTRRLTR